MVVGAELPDVAAKVLDAGFGAVGFSLGRQTVGVGLVYLAVIAVALVVGAVEQVAFVAVRTYPWVVAAQVRVFAVSAVPSRVGLLVVGAVVRVSGL